MGTIRLSVPDWCCYRQEYEPDSYYQALHRCGITGVEMVDPHRWQAARQAGLSIVNLAGPGMTRGLNRIEHHAELLPQIREAITLAQANSIPQVIIFSGNRDGLADDVGLANCAQGIRELAPQAEDAGVTLLFEMLNSQEHVDYQGDRSAFGFTLVRQVDSPAVKVLYDIYHMQRMGEDVLSDITQHIELIGHIHVAESPRRTRPLLQGNIAHANLIPAIRGAGYQGYWGLEFLPQGDALTEVAEVVTDFLSINSTASQEIRL